VKVAFVVGFFNSLETSLRVEFKQEIDTGRLVFFNTPSPRYSFSFPKFKGQFFDVAMRNDQDTVYVLAADMRHAELSWVRGNLEGIVDSARAREDCRPIELTFFENAQDFEAIAEALRQCQLAGPIANHPVDEESLRKHMNGQKTLCVRGMKQGSFEDALRRANIQFKSFGDHFEEMPLSYGSNVGKTLREAAKRYGCLLYAWGELKYVQPALKDKWGAFHQGKTPADAVARFKQAVLGAALPEDEDTSKS
jgi:hypothetical protein